MWHEMWLRRRTEWEIASIWKNWWLHWTTFQDALLIPRINDAYRRWCSDLWKNQQQWKPNNMKTISRFVKVAHKPVRRSSARWHRVRLECESYRKERETSGAKSALRCNWRLHRWTRPEHSNRTTLVHSVIFQLQTVFFLVGVERKNDFPHRFKKSRHGNRIQFEPYLRATAKHFNNTVGY